HFHDDFAWSLRRHEKPVPGDHIKAGDTVLGDGWHFGGDRGALGARVTESPHLARSRIVERGAAGEEEMHATGNKVVHRRGSATIRHMYHLVGGRLLEQITAEGRAPPHVRRGGIELARICGG